MAVTVPSRVLPDVAECGGLSERKQFAAPADAFGRYLATYTTEVGIGLVLHVPFRASTPAGRYAQGFNRVASRQPNQLLTTPLVAEDGQLRVPHAPGLGVALNDEAVERLVADPTP